MEPKFIQQIQKKVIEDEQIQIEVQSGMKAIAKEQSNNIKVNSAQVTQYDLDQAQKQAYQPALEDAQRRLSIEQVFNKVGQDGIFQKLSLALMSCLTLVYTIFLFIYPYFYTKPNFLCANEECDEKKYCEFDPQNRLISEDSINSIVKQFELYCDNRILSSIGSSLPYFGGFIGIFIMLIVSDNYGRRIAYGISWVVATFGALILVLFHNYLIGVLVGSFFIGFGCPANNIGQISITENSVGQFSGISLCILYCVYGISMMLIWPITMVTTDWYEITLYFVLIPHIICNFVSIISKESPQYLLTKDLNQGIKLLKHIAQMNNKKDIEFQQDQFQPVVNKKTKYNFLDLFRFKSLRKQTVLIILAYVGIYQLYYGMQQGLLYIGDKFVQNIFYMGIADFFGSLFSNMICPNGKRKRWTMITTLIPGLLCVTLIFFTVPDDCKDTNNTCYQKYTQIILCVLARFVTTFSQGFMGLWCKELYPTPIRSIGGGGVEAIAYGSVTFTPFLISFVENFINPVTVIGFISIFLSFFGIFLKETQGQPVQQYIKELQINLSRQNTNENNEIKQQNQQ